MSEASPSVRRPSVRRPRSIGSTTSKAVSRVRTRTARRKFLGRSDRPSTKTPLGKWLCSQTGQLPIGEPWCCRSCYQAKCREWHKLSLEQQGATAAASPASAAAAQPQPSPAPTPSTSRTPPKLFANLKAGGSQERAIKKGAWQLIDDILKHYHPSSERLDRPLCIASAGQARANRDSVRHEIVRNCRQRRDSD